MLQVDAVVARVLSTLQSNPEFAVGLAVVALVVVVAVYRLVRRPRPMGKQFVRALADVDEIAVLMHPNPDPDAMAAAVGIAELAEQVGVKSTLQYMGQIRHPENRAFRTVLDLDLNRIEHVSELAAEHVVLVDHNTPRRFAGAGGVLPFAVVDHHPGEGKGEDFTDVRTDYGACSSIVAEYFRDVGGEPVPPDQHASEIDAPCSLPSEVATGLLYGILADTKHLTAGCSAADFEAAAYLSAGVDELLLDRIANPEVDAEVLDVKAQAIKERKVEGPFAISDVGSVSNVDAIPQAAEELIQHEGVTAVVVFGDRDGVIHLSGRSRDDRVHMGRALQTAVDGNPEASAGGHARMGGGQIPIADADLPMPEGASQKIQRRELENRLFDAMTGDV